MMSTRRTYTSEFKIEAVRLVTEEGYSTRQAAESLGVSQNALRTWRRRLENEADNAFPGKGVNNGRKVQRGTAEKCSARGVVFQYS